MLFFSDGFISNDISVPTLILTFFQFLSHTTVIFGLYLKTQCNPKMMSVACLVRYVWVESRPEDNGCDLGGVLLRGPALCHLHQGQLHRSAPGE